ncbi:zeta toxin family protein [Halpernia frigidisoli]|uniref:Uridine kinase n=1 Tax=Halpernia frigidisoli TaxID=1125876 RepID=A0A1I3H1X2_9FLAO|nr:zeta toxin family protein [Halpernia frigidisoli]SFI29691.1 uridine kinase [Halpernia frigidisoli]
MIGDKINIKAEYFSLAEEIYLEILNKNILVQNKVCISVAGESGCGKSVTAEVLKSVLNEKGIKTVNLQQDDYFFLPPKTNHASREKDIRNVGLVEVNLEHLQENIDDFKKAKNQIEKPLVNYEADIIIEEEIDLEKIKVLIVEGTYVNMLENIDLKIFIARTYLDTLEQRKSRNREEMTAFIENVLSIEHNIIKKQEMTADLVINKDYKIKKQLS